MRAVIIGCGGVGGVTASRLKSANTDVSVVTKNPRIAEVIQKDGLEVTVGDDTSVYHLPAYATFPDKKIVPFDTCFLTVPPNFAVNALKNALPHLTPNATIVNLSNGLVEERLQHIVSVDRIVGGVVGFGARMMGPGKVVQTAPGEITFGSLCQDYSKRDAVISLFDSQEGLVHALATDNLRGVRWSKLAINCAVSSLGTVGGERLGVVLRSRNARRMALEIMTEVVKIANLSGVDLEKVSGTLNLNWIALTEAEAKSSTGSAGLLAKHTVLLIVGSKFRKMRSSMLASIERGRYPSVDFLNGEIVERGEQFGFPTPMNKLMLDTVHDLANGDKRPSMDLLAECFQKRKKRTGPSRKSHGVK